MKKVVTLCTLLFFATTAVTHAGNRLPDNACKHHAEFIVYQLLERDFLAPKYKYKIVKWSTNDLRCEDAEHMANFGITTKFLVNENGAVDEIYYYGLFHLHWDHKGKLTTLTEFTKREWRLGQDMNAHHKPWCAWMMGVAKNDPLEQKRCKDFWK